MRTCWTIILKRMTFDVRFPMVKHRQMQPEDRMLQLRKLLMYTRGSIFIEEATKMRTVMVRQKGAKK